MEERFKQVVCADIAFIKNEDEKEKVLLMKRCNTGNDDGFFELPGGHLEANEDIFDAMIRETNEELKVSLERSDIEIVHIMHHYTGERINFIFKSTKMINPVIGEPDKCSEMGWYDIHDLPLNTTDKVKRIIKNINNEKIYDCI